MLLGLLIWPNYFYQCDVRQKWIIQKPIGNLRKSNGVRQIHWYFQPSLHGWKYQCLMLHWRTMRMLFCQIEYSGSPSNFCLQQPPHRTVMGMYVKDHTTFAFGWTDSKKWVRDFGTIHLGRSQILRTFWPLPPLPFNCFITSCRQISMKFDPLPLQIADVLNGWFLWCCAKKVIICQIGDIFFFSCIEK